MWQCLPVTADLLRSTDFASLMRIHKEIKTERGAGSEVCQRRVKVIRKKKANLENSFLFLVYVLCKMLYGILLLLNF